MSNKKTQAELSADYRLSSRQHLSASFEYVDTKRWCNNAAANNAQGSLDAAATGGWAAYTAATCAEVPDTKEDKTTARLSAQGDRQPESQCRLRLLMAQGRCSATFYNPMQAVDNPAGSGAGAEGYEVLGFMSFFEASRHEQIIKAGANWQPGDKLSVSLNGRYTEDQYTTWSTVCRTAMASVNFDSTFIFTNGAPCRFTRRSRTRRAI
jgi:hypothetical protein